MITITVTLIICVTIIVSIAILQQEGFPTITIETKAIHPEFDNVPVPELPSVKEEEPLELTEKEKKDLLLTNPAAAINAYLEGEYDLGL